ncbi:MAG: GNAT family N-acetyltransferase [Flavobacteriaceae bacterium]
MKIGILKKADITPAVQDQVSALFQQLSPGKKEVSLKKIFERESQITLAYCKNAGRIIGIALMVNYSVISGKKAWIEDVVVDVTARGKGVGRKLMMKLLEVAREKSLSEVLLFTEDHRKSAIHLYQSLGFKLKDSKIYILKSE